jgi:drug/metabolite transporter (DMT)-like permease
MTDLPAPMRSGVRAERSAMLALVAAVTALSFAAIFFRLAAPAHPLVIAGTRLALAGLLLSPWTIASIRRGVLRGEKLRGAMLAGGAYAVHFGTWVTSLTLTSVAASVTLVTATPLLLGLVAIAIGRDQPLARHWIALVLALAGVAIIGGGDFANPDALTGDALAFAGAVAMAGYMLLARRYAIDVEPFAFTGAAAGVAGVVLLGTALALGVPIAFPTLEAFGFVVLSTLIPQLIGHNLLTYALRHTRPTVVGLSTVGEPVGSTLLGWLLLHEVPGSIVLVGCAITVAAVILSLSGPLLRRPAQRAQPPSGS